MALSCEVSTGSGSDRVIVLPISPVASIETRSLVFPVLTSSSSLMRLDKPLDEIFQHVKRYPEPVISRRSQIVYWSNLRRQRRRRGCQGFGINHPAAQSAFRLDTTNRDWRHTAQRDANIGDLIGIHPGQT